MSSTSFQRCWLALLLATTISVSPSGVSAGSSDVRIDDVAVGFDGYYKVGDWTPISVEISTDRAMQLTLTVESIDPGGNPAILPCAEVDLPEPGTHRISGVYRSGRLDSPVVVRLLEGDVELASRTLGPLSENAGELRPALMQSTLLVLTLGQPAGFVDLETASEAADNPSSSVRVVQLDDAASLPVEPDGLSALDVLVIAGQYDEVEAERGRVIEDWVRRGGHLILAVGEETELYRNSPLAEWIPVPVTGQTNHGQLSGLESYSRRNVRISGRRANVPGAALDVPEHQVLVSGRDGPLIVAAPFGFGRVTFLAIDLNRQPISDWRALPELIQRLLGRSLQSNQETRLRDRGGLTKSGISDLATQLHAVQDHFPTIGRMSTFPVMGLLVLYMLLIGPIDYLLVHRLLGRPQLTWITFPLFVVGAAGLLAWSAADSNGDTTKLNQLAIIDADQESGFVRSTTWQTLYSPQSERYSIDVLPQTGQWYRSAAEETEPHPVHNQRTIWAGVPESSFGGLYRAGGSALGQPPYHLELAASGISDLPIRIWTSKSLKTTWQHHDHAIAQSDLESRGTGRLSGTISHSLPGPLANWMLVYRDRLYLPKAEGTTGERPALPPNRPYRIESRNVDRRMLLHFLTGTIIVENESGRGDQFQAERADYDPAGRDPREILRVLTFYRFINGKTYTNLDNNALRELDLSELLELNRALLVGWIEEPAARVEVNGDFIEPERPSTCVRIVIPVKPAAIVEQDEAFRETE